MTNEHMYQELLNFYCALDNGSPQSLPGGPCITAFEDEIKARPGESIQSLLQRQAEERNRVRTVYQTFMQQRTYWRS